MIKHDLIKEIGIEKAKAIVEGRPTQDCFYDNYEGLYYSKDHDHCWEWWDLDCKEWFECEFVVNQNEDGFIHLNDLRTAIAEYDSPQLCIECGSADLHKGGEIKEPKMCFKCYAAMTGFTLIGDQLLEDDELAEIKAGHRIDKRLEPDDCTDIRNHLSP
ncbi:hypothetical protein EXE10_20915, partial [Acinetobacter sp. WCHAc060033]|uniref:hypothetical protein n=1 Tax=Acinetobacter sp. WCHAc060033 TaxID=2518624 RepID=UPI001023CC3A